MKQLLAALAVTLSFVCAAPAGASEPTDWAETVKATASVTRTPTAVSRVVPFSVKAPSAGFEGTNGSHASHDFGSVLCDCLLGTFCWTLEDPLFRWPVMLVVGVVVVALVAVVLFAEIATAQHQAAYGTIESGIQRGYAAPATFGYRF